MWVALHSEQELTTYLFVFSPRAQDRVNSILKERWYDLTDDGKHTWKEWEAWDAKRYEHQLNVYEKKQGCANKKVKSNDDAPPKMNDGISVPKKSIPKKSFLIPKKRK